MLTPVRDAIKARREREIYLPINTHIGLRVSQIAAVNLRLHAMTYGSNPSELARVLMDVGAKKLGMDLDKLL
jgi:hypothetical protein